MAEQYKITHSIGNLHTSNNSILSIIKGLKYKCYSCKLMYIKQSPF
jgi:hypothetical protein